MVMPTVRCFTLGSCLAVVLLAGVAAGSEDKPIVAVFDIENRDSGLSEKALLNLTDYMVGLLAESGYSIIPRDQLKARLLEQKQDSHRTCYEQNCQVELGREMAAQKSLSSQIFQLGGACRITITMYDLRKAATDQAVTSKAECNEKDLVMAIEEAIKKLSASNAQQRPLPAALAAELPRPTVATTPQVLAQPLAKPVEQVEEKKTPPIEPPKVEPGPTPKNFRLLALFGLGASGKMKAKTDLAEFKADMDPSYGAGVGLDYLLAPMLGLGVRFHLDSLKAAEGTERFKSVLMLVSPSLRLAFGDLETYLAIPLGLAVLVPAESAADKQMAFALHLLAGMHYWVSDNLGLFAELGLGMTAYTESADALRAGADLNVSVTEMRLQMGFAFGI